MKDRSRFEFKPRRGGHRVFARMPCPICGHASNCEISAPVKGEDGQDYRAVRCRRVKDATTGGDFKTIKTGQDGKPYHAGRTEAGGRVWEPMVNGRPLRPSALSPEERAAREAEDAASAEAKRHLAEMYYMQACGGSIASDQGVDHPVTRRYLQGRGIDPAWLPGGKVPRPLRYCPDFPVFFDFEKPGGTKDPLRQGTMSKWTVRTVSQVPAPGEADRGAAMIAAALSGKDKSRMIRGVHATYLSERGDDVVKDERRIHGGRRWHASCDGLVIFGAEGSEKGKIFPTGVALAGEGAETTLSGFVGCGCRHTALMLKSADSLAKLGDELAELKSASEITTVVILVDLDKLLDKDGRVSRTGQRKATAAAQNVRERCPWITVYLRWVRADEFPELVKRVRLEGEDLARAGRGELGCAIDVEGDETWEHVPIGKDADWNDPLRGGVDRSRLGAAIMREVDVAGDRRRGWEYIAQEEARLKDQLGDVIARAGSQASDGAEADAHAGEGGRTLGPLKREAGAGGAGGGGGGGDGGGGVVDDESGDEEGRPEDDGSPDFWGPPRWGGYTWIHPDDHRTRRIISSRGLDRARLFLLQKCRDRDDRRFRLAYWGGQWFWFERAAWSKVKERQLAGMIAEWLGKFWHRRVLSNGDEKWGRVDPGERAITEILAKLAAECWVDVERMPSWLPAQIAPNGEPMWGESVRTWMIDDGVEDRRGDAADYLVDREGMIRLSWLVKVARGEYKHEHLERLPHTPDLFTTASLPFSLPLDDLMFACAGGNDEKIWDRLCPVYWRWLCEATEDGGPVLAEARRRQLQFMFGDSISGNRDLEVIHFVPGPKRSGKGVLLKAIIASHGRSRVVATSITKLGTQFGLSPLIGAQVAVMGDAHVGQMTDTTQAVENMKSIRGGDEVQAEAKYGDPQTVILPVRLWMFSNDEPDKLQDNSGAFAGSLVVWPMTQSFYGQEDASIKRRVQREGAGIATWALAGYAELFKAPRPRIEMTEIAREVADEFEDASSHMTAFARDCLVMDIVGMPPRTRATLKHNSERDVVFATLYQVYVRWCESNDKRPFGKGKVVGKLRPIVNGGLRVRQPEHEDGTRRRVVEGIALRDDLPDALKFGKTGGTETKPKDGIPFQDRLRRGDDDEGRSPLPAP